MDILAVVFFVVPPVFVAVVEQNTEISSHEKHDGAGDVVPSEEGAGPALLEMSIEKVTVAPLLKV